MSWAERKLAKVEGGPEEVGAGRGACQRSSIPAKNTLPRNKPRVLQRKG